MYSNKVQLIGFLGKDAATRTTKNGREYVVLSLATQSSWKQEDGKYEKRTEWHRCVAWTNLSKFAKSLKKGAHLHLEGELRYREVPDKNQPEVMHSLAEIHLASILKLDRAAKRDPETDPVPGPQERLYDAEAA